MNIAFSIQKYRKDCKITHDPMYGKQRFLPTIEKSNSYSAFEDLEKDGKTHWLNPVARKVGNRIHKTKEEKLMEKKRNVEKEDAASFRITLGVAMYH